MTSSSGAAQKSIMQCFILQYFTAVKKGNFKMKNCDFFSYFCSKHRLWVLVTSTINLCFRAKIRKNDVYPCKPQFYLIKKSCKGVYNKRTCLHDVPVSNYAIRTPSLLHCSTAEDGLKNTTAEQWLHLKLTTVRGTTSVKARFINATLTQQ